jgi:NitT/TauT family transport system substrate-binding protein
LHQVIARKDAGVTSLADIKGKKIGIASVQDTSYYNLLGVLASQHLSKSDVDMQQVGFVGMIQLLASGERQVIVAPPEWAVAVIARNTEITTIPITNVFPAMSQSILASDRTIKERPELIRRFVRATLRGVRAIMDNPAQAAHTFFTAVSQSTPEDQVLDVMKRYVAQVYATNPIADLGKIDPKRIEALQAFYLKSGIIRAATPVDELFTNEFVGKQD